MQNRRMKKINICDLSMIKDEALPQTSLKENKTFSWLFEIARDSCVHQVVSQAITTYIHIKLNRIKDTKQDKRAINKLWKMKARN